MKNAYQLNLVSIALEIRHDLILPATPTFLLFSEDPEEIKKALPAEYGISLNAYSPDQLHFLGSVAEKAHGFISEDLWWAWAVIESLF